MQNAQYGGGTELTQKSRTAQTREGEPTAEDGSGDAKRGIAANMRRFKPLWPLILGLSVGRAGIITSSYGSYIHTDEGMLTDGATLVALAFLGVLLIILAVTKHTLSKRAVNRIMRTCVAAEVATLLFQSWLDYVGAGSVGLRFGLSVVSSITAAGVIYYWLRRARGSGMKTAAVFVFSALLISEIEIYLCALLPASAANCLAGVLALLQLPCMRWARAQQRPDGISSSTQTSDFFGFTKTMISSKLFLIATAIGIGFLSIVIGLLRGYPNGVPIAFSFVTRTAYGLLTMALCLAIVVLVLAGRKRIMTVGMFLLMEGLACLALILYAAFPDALDIGAVFTTTLNALMNGFTWYIIIAFMSYGWRDPYYYAIAGRLVFLGARAIARIFLLLFYQVFTNDLLMGALMGALLVISTQVVFMQLLRISRLEQEETLHEEEKLRRRTKEQDGMLAKLMGLDENFAEVRQASMRHNAEELGRRFLLSEREVEVLSLYALGYTQKRVAEELYITPATAHAHIKRIYAKTGMHSRQELLDFLETYTS